VIRPVFNSSKMIRTQKIYIQDPADKIANKE
jgi:hypothetical protein